MSRSRRQKGIALITVLWLITLLTLLAGAAITLSVTHRRTASRYATTIQADLTLDAALRVLLLRLAAPPDRAPPFPLGNTQTVSVLDERVSVIVQREAGRIDLNTADIDLLTAFFAANDWTEADARSMAARIVDWRDPDDETEPGGAESREYQTAQLSYGPHDGPFESVEELHQVLGSERISSELFESLTVFTHAPGSVESAATPAVKRALIWADQRQLGGHRWLKDAPNAGPSAVGILSAASLSGEVLRLRACAGHPAERCRVAVVRLTGNTKKPLQVFEWRAAPAQ
jgi:general secretion pathway protein K